MFFLPLFIMCVTQQPALFCLWSLFSPKELFASGGSSLNRSPKLDTNDNTQRDESHSVLWEHPHGDITSRCQGCKYISHWGLFIFVFQIHTSTHGCGNLLNKAPLSDLEVNKLWAQINMVCQNCHGNIRCCQQMQTTLVALVLQTCKWHGCVEEVDSFYPWNPPL